ncbi:MAG: hypothetical protein JSS75_00175 [Bacteroidetes bacterium]|nr:hypothetical protein [Bacteroidota bacterium]
MKTTIFAYLALLLFANISLAQHRLQIDNGPSKIGILDGSLLPAGTTVLQWPATGGTIMTQSGGITSFNGVSYAWPAANAAGVLTNDGSGNLSWSPVGGSTWTGGGSANTIAYWTSATNLSYNSNLTYNGTTLSVSNNSSSNALTVANAGTAGVALGIASGLVKLSTETIAMPIGAGAGNINIVGNNVIVVITDNGGTGGDKTIVLPSGVDGQILIIINNDNNQKAKAPAGSGAGSDLDTAAKDTGMWIYYASAWHRLD